MALTLGGKTAEVEHLANTCFWTSQMIPWRSAPSECAPLYLIWKASSHGAATLVFMHSNFFMHVPCWAANHLSERCLVPLMSRYVVTAYNHDQTAEYGGAVCTAYIPTLMLLIPLDHLYYCDYKTAVNNRTSHRNNPLSRWITFCSSSSPRSIM